MFQSPILDVAIGMIFLYLLLSLLGMALQEAWAGRTNLRGKLLLTALRNMIGDQSTDDLLSHPLISGVVMNKDRKAPSYIDKEAFATAFYDSLTGYTGLPVALNTLPNKIATFPDPAVRRVLNTFDTSSAEVFRAQLAAWFETTMDRSTGYYKRTVQQKLLLLGFIISIVLNADSIRIFRHLSTDEEARLAVVQQAVTFVEEHPEKDSLRSVANDLLQREINRQHEELKHFMGLGWSPVEFERVQGVWQWLWWIIAKAAGITISAFAVTIGAPFWFDLLKRVVHLRNAGKKPEET